MKNDNTKPGAVEPASTGYAKYLEYITNVGKPCRIEWFDDDWSPIGLKVRADMQASGLTKEKDGYISLA